ncbi:MAG: baseplate J/gp47 family protein, partial [Anaerolineae bacterium]|nr:baseplate J/gp47 family protein [Anaerolineae bacterium]
WRTSLLGRVVAFTAGVMAVLVVAGLFVPRAAVTLNPDSQTASVVIPVRASVENTSISLSGEIPAQTISLVVEREETVAVTSQVSIPQTKAKGVAQFTNLGTQDITIPAGTVVLTDSLIRFATLNETRLPSGTNGIVEVRIEALEAGEQGNVAAETIKVIEGTLGLSATVMNPSPTIGGTNANVPGATEDDRANLRDTVLKLLRIKAEEEIRASIGEGDLLIVDTLDVVETQREEFTPPAGKAAANLTFSMQAEVTAHYILADDLNRLAASSVSASVPAGFSPSGEMTFDLLDVPVTDLSGVTSFHLQASQTALRDIDLMQVYNLIRGRSPQAAAIMVKEALSLQNEPQITITPSWWRWLPLIPFNISVEVE